MGMRALGLIAVLTACGGPKPAERLSPAPPTPHDASEPGAADAAVAVVAPAPPSPPPKPFSRDDLPVWTPLEDTNKWSEGAALDVYAADVDGDSLLRLLSPRINFAHKSMDVRLTGRLSTSAKQDAFSTVAKLLGLDVKPIKSHARAGGTIDVDFGNAPLSDLMRLLADVGNVNVVIAPGQHPPLTVRFKRVHWEQAIRVLAERSGLTVVRLARMYYLVPPGTMPPPPNPTLKGPALTIDMKDATLAQVVTGIRALGKLEPGSCSATKVTLRLKRVTPAETLKALAVASGETLADTTPCPSKILGDEPIDELQLVAIAESGTKRVAVFDHKGATVIGTVDKKHITDIGTGYVSFAGDRHVRVHPSGPVPPSQLTEGDWIRSLQRTSALVRRKLSDGNEVWTAIVETTNGVRSLQKGDRPGRWLGPSFTEKLEPTIFVDVRDDGVHILRIEDDTEVRELLLSPK